MKYVISIFKTYIVITILAVDMTLRSNLTIIHIHMLCKEKQNKKRFNI